MLNNIVHWSSDGNGLNLVLANMLPHPAVLKSRYQKKRLVSDIYFFSQWHWKFCLYFYDISIILFPNGWVTFTLIFYHPHVSSPGEDVRGGGGDLHGVLGSLPHLLHPLLSLSSHHSQGVDLKCLPGGAVILINPSPRIRLENILAPKQFSTRTIWHHREKHCNGDNFTPVQFSTGMILYHSVKI